MFSSGLHGEILGVGNLWADAAGDSNLMAPDEMKNLGMVFFLSNFGGGEGNRGRNHVIWFGFGGRKLIGC